MTDDAPRLHPLPPGDLGWIVERHGTAHARDEGVDQSFEMLVAGILADFAERHDPPREAGWIVRQGDRRLGSIFCAAEDETTARLRLFSLGPEARGSGFARRMPDRCLRFARDAGYLRLVLWTHERHRAAGSLYRRAGFRNVRAQPALSFLRDAVGQTRQIDLPPAALPGEARSGRPGTGHGDG